MNNKNLIVLTIATQENEHLNLLVKNLSEKKVNFKILGENSPWLGMGTKTFLLQKYLLKTQFSHFLLIDAYDVLFLNELKHIWKIYIDNWYNQIVFAAEKFCYPDIDLCDQYPEVDSPWCYLNAGCYMAPVDKFLKLISKYPFAQTENDQGYFTNIFLKKDNDIILDTSCKLFQCLNFEFDGEFVFDRIFKNNVMGTAPCIIHGNGNTPMERFYKYM